MISEEFYNRYLEALLRGDSIRVDSRPDHGACFRFSIPIHRDHQEEQS